MTEPKPINLFDTDYAAFVAGDYDPNLERLMTEAGESPTQKTLQAEEDWQELGRFGENWIKQSEAIAS